MEESYTAGVALEADGRFTITLTGELSMESRASLRELVDACIDAGATSILFDMLAVTLCGSDCVGLLAYADRFDIPLAIRPSACVLRTLEMVGMASRFRIVLE